MEYSRKTGVLVYTFPKKKKNKTNKQTNGVYASHSYLLFRILNLDMEYQPEM